MKATTNPSRNRILVYWLTTGILALECIVGGVMGSDVVLLGFLD